MDHVYNIYFIILKQTFTITTRNMFFLNLQDLSETHSIVTATNAVEACTHICRNREAVPSWFTKISPFIALL